MESMDFKYFIHDETLFDIFLEGLDVKELEVFERSNKLSLRSEKPAVEMASGGGDCKLTCIIWSRGHAMSKYLTCELHLDFGVV